MEYTLRQFLKDLKKIRDHTFKRLSIQHAFKKSGIYPLSLAKCIKQLKSFNPPELRKPKVSLPTLSGIAYKYTTGLRGWKRKISKAVTTGQWSDSVREEEFEYWV